MSSAPSTEHEAVARDILIVTTILFGLMILEYAWNFRLEKQVIWPKFLKSHQVKIFVITRYMGFAGQIFNVWFANRMSSGIPRSPLACRVWYTYQAVSIQSLTMSVEALLMLRVRKMYKKDKHVLGILFAFSCMQCAATVISARTVVPGIGSSPTCMVIGSHPGQIYVGASTIAVHLCLLAMILWRYFRVRREGSHSYLKILVRDTICIVIVVTGTNLLVTLPPMGLPRAETSANMLFHVKLFSLWVAVGRLVLDKERSRQESRDDPDSDLTDIDLDELEPADNLDVCPVRLSDSKVAPTEVSTDSKSGSRTEVDIADECIYDWVDDASLSSCVPSILRTDMGNPEEGSRSMK